MPIWRVVMEGKATLTEIKSGEVDLVDILKINALLDLRDAFNERELARQQQNRNRK
jgi:hypothetical protein